MKRDFSFKSFDDKKIPATAFKTLRAKATVQIVHGMAEHRKRYEDFALYLNKNNFNVYTMDLRGHGENIQNGDVAGYFGKDGWNACLNDIFELNQIIHKENPKMPVFVLGHSMGSFLTRNYMLNSFDTADGFILSGTGTSLGLSGHVMIWKAKQEIKQGNEKKPSSFLSALMNKTLNRKFHEEEASGFEWVTSDALQLKKYIADPLCGFTCTPNLFLYMAQANLLVNKKETIEKYSGEAEKSSVLFVSGSEDPVGGKKSVQKLSKLFKKNPSLDVSSLIYEGARHEVLNELNNQEVYYDIVQWLNKNTNQEF